MISKGVFTNPRSLGKVSDIFLISSQIRRMWRLGDGGEYEIHATVVEGEEQQNGDFLSKTEEAFQLDVKGFSGPEKTILRNYLKLLIRKYAEHKGYSDLTVS